MLSHSTGHQALQMTASLGRRRTSKRTTQSSRSVGLVLTSAAPPHRFEEPSLASTYVTFCLSSGRAESYNNKAASSQHSSPARSRIGILASVNLCVLSQVLRPGCALDLC